MEELFEQLYKEANCPKYASIKEGSLLAKEILESQTNLMKCSPYDLRATCMKPLQEALETHNSRMMTLAISGFHKLLRDNQFYAEYEEPDETKWLPSQILSSLQSLPTFAEDIQVELLKVILSMSCVSDVSMSGHLVVQILGVCGLAFGRGNASMKSASQSAAVQSIVALLHQIRADCEDQEKEYEDCCLQNPHEEESQTGIYDFVAPAFDELVPVINFIAEKLTEAHKHRENKRDVEIPALFLLECTNSILKGLSNSNDSCPTEVTRKFCQDKSSWQPPAYCSTLLVSALWQRLCPALIALLGTPVSMRVSRGSGRTQGQMGRGSGTASLPSLLFNSQEAKAIYSVACNLVVAMGTVGEMRPVLESLFHRMLLYPPPSCRQDSLREVGEMLKNPGKLIQLAGPILHSDPRNRYQSDLSLFRLTMDSLIECSNCKNPSMQMTIVSCASSLLASLETLCDGKSLSLLHTTAINDAFPQLEDVDYSGPVTYGSQHLQDSKFEFSDNLSTDSEELPDTFSQYSEGEEKNADKNVAVDENEDIDEKKIDENEDIDEKKIDENEDFDEKKIDENEDIDEKKIDENDDDNEKTFDNKVDDEKKIDETDDLDMMSSSSGDTEGPVDDPEFQNEQKMLADEEDLRLQRLSEGLEPPSDSIRSVKDEEKEREQLNAQHFCITLQALLPSLLAIRSTIEVDEAALEFSSKYCQGVFNHTMEGKNCPIIINADGIYLTTYAAISLNLKLMKSGYYCERDEASLLMTQEQFVESVYGSGVLIYLSTSWIGEVYNQVIKDSFLQRAGYSPQSPYNCALINLITDLDGLGSIENGSQMLSDYRRLEKAAVNTPRSVSKDAGRKLCRRILTCCWESILSILGTLLNHLEGEGGILVPLRLLLMGENLRKDEAQRGQDTLILCLNSLQSTARLANQLGLQKRCGMVFSLLSSACLPKNDLNPLSTPQKSRFRSPSLSKKPLKLHTAHVLSFHVMMSSGLELGSHTPDCWSHLFRCCLYLSELERKFFSASEKAISFSTLASNLGSGNVVRETKLSVSDDDYFSDDIPTSVPYASSVASLTIEDLMVECQKEVSNSGFLSTQISGKALCCLTLLIDKFFDNASTQLNLSALISFMKELCKASQNQLFSRINPCTPKKGLLKWAKLKKKGETSETRDMRLIEESLLLHRLGEVMLKVVRSGRPLVHIMKLWAVAGPHFLEAACHKDTSVSKKAICCIHDVVNSLLGNQVELPHFHFNEALFKPFENLLCLELCDFEIQDQIVSSICEFVESCSSEIKSGWRPLFGALRCVRPMPVAASSDYLHKDSCHESVGHLRAVRDVFEAFLTTDNVLVFANAALDCILCLLKHVKGPIEGELVTETVVCWGELVGGDLCLDALRYLHRCAVTLTSMYMMPTPPVFHSAHRINMSVSRHIVDSNIPGIDETHLWKLIGDILTVENEEKVDYTPLWPVNIENEICLEKMEEGCGILQVWYVLLEGLAGSVITCPRRHQPQVLDTLFTLMQAIPHCHGSSFGLYCINHLLLPIMQEWLRRSENSPNAEWEHTQSFKQFSGLTSDLIVDYLKRASYDESPENDPARRLMLQQVLVVLVECISSSVETVSRLGCSCIRHIILSCGDKLPSSLWDIMVRSLHRASQVSLFSLYQLMQLFCPESPNFYGDIGQVKVAARRDCTSKDSDRLRQISHQVFLLDSQRSELTSIEENPDVEDRSFIFLLYSSATDNKSSLNEEEGSPIRVPFRTLVVGLLANQMILQTLGHILVKGSPHVIPSLANVLLQASDFSSADDLYKKNGNLPGMVKYLSHEHILILLDSLSLSYEASVQFDRRPGLKFLIQKVSQAEKAGNLYKQAGASWTLRMLTLFDLILFRVKNGLDLNQVKLVLDAENRNKNTIKYSDHDTIDSDNHSDSPPRRLSRPTTLMEEDTQQYIHKLSKAFTELCEAYLELKSNRTDNDELYDRVDDQPIFFLTIPADEFSTTHRKSLKRWAKSLEEFNKDYIKANIETDEEGNIIKTESKNQIEESSSSLPATMIVGGPPSSYMCEEDDDATSQKESPRHEKKPFSFADLAQALDTDDEDDDSSCTKEDSGVASGTGVDQSVYSIATEKDISAMMGDYRRRKNTHSIPSQVSQKRFNPFVDSPQQQSFRPSDSVPPEIEEQRNKSLMKDSEAHLKVWTEMVVTIFDVISQLKDNELRPILPLVFPTMRSLTAHAHDPHLRQVVAELLNRVACLYGFSPAE